MRIKARRDEKGTLTMRTALSALQQNPKAMYRGLTTHITRASKC